MFSYRLLVALCGFLMGVWAALWMQSLYPFDFMTFWTSAQHVGAPYDPRWIEPYEHLHKGIKLPFAYPPVLLLLLYPLGHLPLKVAFCIWSGGSLALLSFVSTYIARASAPLLFLSAPAMMCAALGQTGLIVASAMIGGMLLLERRPILAGAVLACAACIKPQAMLAAPIVLWGRWDVVKAAIATSICLVLATFVFGPARWIEWGRAMVEFRQWLDVVRTVAPAALFPNILWKAAVTALGVWLALRKDLLGLVVGGLCLTPYAQLYDLAAFAVVGLAWIGRWRDVGILPTLTGALMAFGFFQSPVAVLVVALVIVAIQLRWAPLARPNALAVFSMASGRSQPVPAPS